jgi:hypothetical protein
MVRSFGTLSVEGGTRHGVSLLSGGSGRLDTRLDTPPSIKRRRPDSRIAREALEEAYATRSDSRPNGWAGAPRHGPYRHLTRPCWQDVPMGAPASLTRHRLGYNRISCRFQRCFTDKSRHRCSRRITSEFSIVLFTRPGSSRPIRSPHRRDRAVTSG